MVRIMDAIGEFIAAMFHPLIRRWRNRKNEGGEDTEVSGW
jgi:hypothetical protein